MLDTMTRYLSKVGAALDREAMRGVMEPIVDRMSSQALATAGLVISTTGTGVTAKIGTSDFYATAGGHLVTIANGTDMPALVGTITATYYNVFCFFIDSAGTVTSQIGTQALTMAGVVFPQLPKNKALVGFIIVYYAAGLFTGGTTPLSTATTVYVSPVGAFDPTILI